MIKHSKRNGRTYTQLKGLAPFATPGNVQRELDALSDEALIAALHKGPFVDPFVMAEIMVRGIYHKVPPPPKPDYERPLAETLAALAAEEE